MTTDKRRRVFGDAETSLAKRLREFRTIRGLTQREIAERIGVRFQQIHKYEVGAAQISATRLWQLANALGVPISEFYRGLADSDAEAHDPSESPDPPQRPSGAVSRSKAR